MKLIEDYKKAKQAIYDHVGFEEDWVVCPLDDCTDKYWSIVNGDEVHYADSREELITKDGESFIDDLYKQRFYDKWIYEGKDFTMIFCNPHLDGMKWFRLFDNNKRVDESTIEEGNHYLI